MLNGRNRLQKGYKAPLFKSTRPTWEAYFNKTKKMLLSLKLSDGTPVASSNRGTPVIGFCLAMDGFISLADRFFNDPQSGIKYFLPYRLSQDQLELHFAKIRGRGGWNNNPTSTQFQAAYRALLINSNIPVSTSGNATWFLEAMGTNIHEDRKLPSDGVISVEISTIEAQTSPSTSPPAELSMFQQNVTAYIAGYTIRSIQGKCHSCDKCKEALVDRTDEVPEVYLQLIRLKDNGGLIIPSKSVLNIAMASERILREQGTKPTIGQHIRDQLCVKIIHSLNHGSLFPNLHEQYDCDFRRNHVLQLIKDFVNHYLVTRLHFVAFTYNRDIRGQSIRNHMSRMVIFQNQ
ncbi:uncharacterized protein LOC115921324 [Strongylocentrotus purpuratus]|uniref:Transposable element P transposase-like RNase H C-terminal domain-containing protein n=1 Tax=Strongylocentrotus purpuratus TaxID=7668 RepID=A0A7M7NEU9_STRPU|nr:uncharacterized protein LOC115921324 [Strongylocentrotus purpuratus]